MCTFSKFCTSFSTGERKIIIQTVIGRSGSLMLQSLLDNHPQILMFPGILNFYSTLWDNLNNSNNNQKKILLNHFIFLKDLMTPYNIYHHVGKHGNESTEIDYSKIIEEIEALSFNRESRREVFLAIHFAFCAYFRYDINKIKFIYCHEHSIDFNDLCMRNIINDFPDAQIFCSVRSATTNVYSILNWYKKKKKIENVLWQKNRYQFDAIQRFCIYWYIDGIRLINNYYQHFKIIRLEDIQKNPEAFMKVLCQILGIEFSKSLTETTFAGKLWHGDIFSDKKTGVRDSAIKVDVARPLIGNLLSFLASIYLKPVQKEFGYVPENKRVFVIEKYVLLITCVFWFYYSISDRWHHFVKKDNNYFSRKALMIIKKNILEIFSDVKNFSAYLNRRVLSCNKLIFIGK